MVTVTPNQALHPTGQQLCHRLPSSLGSSAAGEGNRYAAFDSSLVAIAVIGHKGTLQSAVQTLLHRVTVANREE